MQDQALRIIDANLNRAREGLRVVEEYARFCLDDAALTQSAKSMRHDLGEAAGSFEACLRTTGEAVARTRDDGSDVAALSSGCSPTDNPIVAHRDTVGDVGTTIEAHGEYHRQDAHEVAAAAAKRLTEALRAIEEYGKIFDATFAERIERIRYRAYTLEQRLLLTARSQARFATVGLYVIITEALCRSDWFKTAEAALLGGADCLQLREKSLSDRKLLDRARRLTELCIEHEKLAIINDRPDIAAACGAHGVHLGQDDLDVVAARKLLPSSYIVGISTHSVDQIERAAETVPDYIAVGPMFASSTKPQNRIAGTETLAAARRHTSIPLVAIGGIDETNCDQVLTAAPCCVCVCQSVTGDTDPKRATERLRKLVERARADRERSSDPITTGRPITRRVN